MHDDYAPEVDGEPPELHGLNCEGFVCEQFWCGGELLETAIVSYLQFGGVWHRLVIDCGIVYWRTQKEAPAAWAVPEEGFDYPHGDVGRKAGVMGARLARYTMEWTDAGAVVTFRFESGRQVILTNHSGVTN